MCGRMSAREDTQTQGVRDTGTRLMRMQEGSDDGSHDTHGRVLQQGIPQFRSTWQGPVVTSPPSLARSAVGDDRSRRDWAAGRQC